MILSNIIGEYLKHNFAIGSHARSLIEAERQKVVETYTPAILKNNPSFFNNLANFFEDPKTLEENFPENLNVRFKVFPDNVTVILSSGFSSSRIDPVTGRGARPHNGVDLIGFIKDEKGQTITDVDVISPRDATVVFAGFVSGYGQQVVIQFKHGNDTYKLSYNHLKSIKVFPGQKVSRGQSLGIQGATGRVTGTHLHLEIRINETLVNPINYLANISP